MAEIIGFKWPDTVDIFIDNEFKGTSVIERQKLVSGNAASLWMGTYNTGRFKYADLFLERSDGLKLEYNFTGSFAAVSGSHLTTDLGTATYDKNGYIFRVILQPIERLEERFWRERVSKEDKEIINREENARREILRGFQNSYGADQIPVERVTDLDNLCEVTNKYLRKLKRFKARKIIAGPVLARQGKHWQVESFGSIHGFKPISLNWGQWVIYDGEAICVELLDDDDGSKRFQFKQKTMVEDHMLESKVTIVPRKIDYGLCKRLIHTKDSWQDLFSIYPVDLESSSNFFIGNLG